MSPDVIALLLWGAAHRRWSPATRHVYGHWAGRLLDHLDAADLTVDTVDTRRLAAFIASLPPTASSRNGARSAAVALFDYAMSEGLRNDNPAKGLRSLRDRRRVPATLTRDEAQAVLEAAARLGASAFALVCVLLYAALRISEAAGLRWDGYEGEWLTLTGKGDQERIVPLHPTARAALERWRRECPDPLWVFPSPKCPGEHLSASWLRRVVKQVGFDAGLEGLAPHTLRRSAATRLSELGIPLEVCQEVLGHRDPATTRKYVAVKPTRMAEAVAALDWEAA